MKKSVLNSLIGSWLLLFPNLCLSQLLSGNFTYERVGQDDISIHMSILHPSSVALNDTMMFELPYTYSNPLPIIHDSTKDFCDTLKRSVFETTLQLNSEDLHYATFLDSSFSRNTLNTPGLDSFYSFRTLFRYGGTWNSQTSESSGRFHAKGLKKVEKGDSLIFHPSYTNPDGDEAVFVLESIGDSSEHWIPSNMKVNSKSGEVTWGSPDSIGKYEITLLRRELRPSAFNTIRGREMYTFTVQVTDSLSSNALFQEISGFNRDTSGYIERTIQPGEDLNLVFEFQDEMGDSVALEAIGEPFSQNPSPFFFTSNVDSTTINASFSWSPDSSHVRPHPYILTFIGKSYPSCTWYYKTVMIYVEDPTTFIEEESRKDEEAFTIHPNPVRGELILNASVDLSQSQARVVDAQGRRVKEVQLRKGKDRINVQGLEKGFYFLVVQGEKGRWQERFVKK